MTYGLNEYEQLKFLEQYGFKTENYSTGSYTEICLVRDDVCITYHEWPQFGDCLIFVSNSLKDYQKHKFLRTYNRNWFVNNVLSTIKAANPQKRYSFWELVKFYVENQLANNRPIFEITVK